MHQTLATHIQSMKILTRIEEWITSCGLNELRVNYDPDGLMYDHLYFERETLTITLYVSHEPEDDQEPLNAHVRINVQCYNNHKEACGFSCIDWSYANGKYETEFDGCFSKEAKDPIESALIKLDLPYEKGRCTPFLVSFEERPAFKLLQRLIETLIS